MTFKPPIVCLMGPTAAGKTRLAIDLASRIDCELVSVDSAQIYRGLDIGTAKPSFPHHLIDIRDPNQLYSAVEFAEDAKRLCSEISERGRIPVLVGGSMLYFQILLEGFSNVPPVDVRIRNELEIEALKKGWPTLYSELVSVDPVLAKKIHPNHSRRILRALEVFRSTGKPLSEWHTKTQKKSYISGNYEILRFAIMPLDRVFLHERIEQRFSDMMKKGLLHEVTYLFERGDLNESMPAIRSVGYRQLWSHLLKRTTLEQACLASVAATRQVAKRQLTWLRQIKDLQWIFTNRDETIGAPTNLKNKSEILLHPIDLIEASLAYYS